MRSIAVHLRDADNHDRLPFHPSCPICRETRLTGAALADGLVSLRAQAMLAAGVLAVSATAPTVSAVAAEPDKQQDGAVPAAEGGVPDPAGSVDFDPGGSSTGLPEVAPPAPQTQAPAEPSTDDGGPVDRAPDRNPDEPVVDPGDSAATSTPPAPSAPETATPPAPAATTPTPPAASTPAPGPAQPGSETGVPSDQTDAPAPPAEGTAPGSTPRAAEGAPRQRRVARPKPRRAITAPMVRRQASAPAPGQTATAAAAPPVAAAVVVRGDRAEPGDETHRVLAGESLWSIASDLLGGDATAARVAREVQRLWQLNRDRIATGDPDLLRVGTRLALR